MLSHLRQTHLLILMTTVNSLTTKLSTKPLSKVYSCIKVQTKFNNSINYRADNDRLRGTLKGKEQDLAAAKSALERLTAAVSPIFCSIPSFVIFIFIIFRDFNWQLVKNGLFAFIF